MMPIITCFTRSLCSPSRHSLSRSKSHAQPRLQKGMTLIEVMVALLIFGLTGTAVMKATTENLSSVGQLQDITFATFVANNRLAQLHLAQEWPIKNNAKGQMDMASATWYWQQTVTKTAQTELIQVRVTVASDADYRRPITDVVSFFTKPTANGAP